MQIGHTRIADGFDSSSYTGSTFNWQMKENAKMGMATNTDSPVEKNVSASGASDMASGVQELKGYASAPISTTNAMERMRARKDVYLRLDRLFMDASGKMKKNPRKAG